MVRNLTTDARIVGVNSHRKADANGNWVDNYMYSSEHGTQARSVYSAIRSPVNKRGGTEPTCSSPTPHRPQPGAPVPTIKALSATLAATAAGAAAILGYTQTPDDHPVVQQTAVHDTNPPLTAERIAELSRTGKIHPAGPLPVDENGQVIEHKH
ncbi:hypothetical protein OG749_03350 [Streptomyces nojiriensis]|uniref:hypothetical protein n=1 Tax=Streptomyces nojiriensis TaxID=66374 RepID=UPI002E19926B